MKFIMKFIFITYYTFIFSLFYCITHSTYLTNTSTTVGIFFTFWKFIQFFLYFTRRTSLHLK